MTDSLQRDPDDWKTDDEPMTDAQRSYLHTLATEAGERHVPYRGSATNDTDDTPTEDSN